ncbi:hypothetical protein [Sphaerisporangium corydalis]|uniref:ParB/Sulfiredoxin domain-containing protein n=1 Tax=Sphaerisporangium corydalis TaxID=1441875 RepID=A0ABV9EBH8_9ACTN|nr:hypothetical protein [Sphaerisporangium corydalis]
MSDKGLGRAAARLGIFKAATGFLRKAARTGGGDRPAGAPGPAARLFGGRGGPAANATVDDLRGHLLPDVNGSPLSRGKAERIGNLSDRKLLKAVNTPIDGWHITAYRDSRVVVNGNHRAFELQARARKAEEDQVEDALIRWDTPIYVEWLNG